MRIITLCAVWLLVACSTVRAETDVFMRAIGFALTGSDDAEPKAIDRANCVFGLKKDVFHLNNVHTDRIFIQGWKQTTNFAEIRWVTVSLHGDDVVYETTSEPMKDDGSVLMQQMKEASPEAFKPHHYTYKEHELKLYTSDQDRVTRAWNYIYSHGCVGKKSPF